MAEVPASTQPPSRELRFPIKRVLSVFLVLTLGSIVGIFLYTGNSRFLVDAMRHLWSQPGVITLLVVLLLLEWYSDYLRYYYLARGLEMKLPLGFGMKIVFANLFFAYLTPGGAFGAPVIIYMLIKRGESLSHSIALALIKPFLLFFLLLVGGSLLFWFGDFSLTPTTQNVLITSSIVVGLLTLMVAIIIFLPATGTRLSDGLFGWLRRWQHSRGRAETPRLDRWQKNLQGTIAAFSLFGKNKVRFLLYSLLATALNLAIFLAISVVLLQALGFKMSIEKSWLYSFLYYFVIAFAPTPGGSGIAEGGGYLFFKHLGPQELVASYIVLWRFMSSYLVIIIGGFLFFRFVQELPVDALTQETTPSSDAKGDESHADQG